MKHDRSKRASAAPTKRPAVRSPRWRSLIVVVAGASGAVASGLVASEASANPPAPTGMPDPYVSPPTKSEAPTVVRRHDGGCFVFYPSGGAARVSCPPELAGEPIGEEIDRDASGRCRFVPTVSWSGGKMGPTPCPTVLRVIATVAGTATAAPLGTPPTAVPTMTTTPPPNATGDDPPMYGLQPPSSARTSGGREGKPPGRLDPPETKSGGCGNGCAVGAGGDGAGASAIGAITAIAGLVATRRRRR